MTYSVLIAAPLLIAAVVMAVRFVGCTEDFDRFEVQPGDGDGEGDFEKVKADATLSGSGTLSVTAVAAHPSEETDFSDPGAHSYDIPSWCVYIDLILLGGGGGGSTGLPVGNGGKGGSWQTVTLWRGSGVQPPDVVPIPAATTSISITVGAGGGGGATPDPGGDTIATATGISDQIAEGGAPGGAADANADPTGKGPMPHTVAVGDATATGGDDQTTHNAAGNWPGGGGAGGVFPGGAGADGGAWLLARQTSEQ